ncbi:MAG: flagellar motor switch protein FliN [Endozoicomonadaceae bacterium]|nr:flagellar motor switch protein FliN [Endozoicomonadaceae bacterium]
MSNEESNEESKDEPTDGGAEAPNSSGAAAKADTVNIEDLVGDQGDTDTTAGDNVSPNLELLLDIPVTLSLELGSTTISLGDLLKLNKGSVVALEKEASEPLDVKVNGTLIAFAEVVVINERYGIRLIDVVSESERLQELS